MGVSFDNKRIAPSISTTERNPSVSGTVNPTESIKELLDQHNIGIRAVTMALNEHQGGPSAIIPSVKPDLKPKTSDPIANEYDALKDKEKSLDQARKELKDLEGRLPESRLKDERQNIAKLEKETAKQTADLYENLVKDRLKNGGLPEDLDKRVKDLAQSEKRIDDLKRDGKLTPEAERELRKQHLSQMRELVNDLMGSRSETKSQLGDLKFEPPKAATMAIMQGEGQLGGSHSGAITEAYNEGQARDGKPSITPSDILLRRLRSTES